MLMGLSQISSNQLLIVYQLTARNSFINAGIIQAKEDPKNASIFLLYLCIYFSFVFVHLFFFVFVHC